MQYRALGFDTETHLITTNDVAPKPVCSSWFDGSGAWLTKPGDGDTNKLINDPYNIFVTANGGYDFVLMMRWFPFLIPAIVRAYEEGRVFDVQVRERLIITSTEGIDPKQVSLGFLVGKYLGEDRSAVKSSLDKDGNVIGNVDAWRLRYGTLDDVPFNQWPIDAVEYAMGDARDTFNVFMQQGGFQASFPTEGIDVRADLALKLASTWGMMINKPRLENHHDELQAEYKGYVEKIGNRGWSGTGSKKRQQEAACSAWKKFQLAWMKDYCANHALGLDEGFLQYIDEMTDIRTWLKTHGDKKWKELPGVIYDAQMWNPPMHIDQIAKQIPEPDMGKTGYTFSVDALRDLYEIEPDFKTYADMKHVEKMLSTYIEPFRKAGKAPHPRYDVIKSTGRTSCAKPNMQNPPREGGFRNNFMPRPGRLYGTVDYSAVELATLSETIRQWFGQSPMSDMINRDMDLHCMTAGYIVGKPYEEILAEKKGAHKDDRQKAKACYTADTELLTPVGWARIDELYEKYPSALIAQYNPHTKEISFSKPIGWVTKPSGDVLRFVNDYQDCAVSSDHRMLQVSKAGKVQEVLARDFVDNEQYSCVHGGFANLRGKLSSEETRVAVMVQADGNYNQHSVRLGFSKARKIARCRELLSEALIDFSERSSDGVTTFTFPKNIIFDGGLLNDNKSFVNNIHYYDSEAFCDELFRWDGSVVKKQTAKYFNAKENDVDFAQRMLILNGYKATKREKPDRRGHLAQHEVSWYIGDRKKNTAYARLSGLQVERLPAQMTYCPSVPTSWVVTRRNGKVVIHGNCNFGRPGGLQPKSFVGYAESSYGVKLTLPEAKQIFAAHSQAFPEVDMWVDHWETQVGGPRMRWKGRCDAVNLTGRKRGNCRMTEAANFPFQSLAADGGKTALWDLAREQLLGWYWRVGVTIYGDMAVVYGVEYAESPLYDSHLVNFVHDEIVEEHPEHCAEEAFKRQDEIMQAAMQRMVPGTKISTEGELGDHWAH